MEQAIDDNAHKKKDLEIEMALVEAEMRAAIKERNYAQASANAATESVTKALSKQMYLGMAKPGTSSSSLSRLGTKKNTPQRC